ncbi:MAG: 4Fe-4S binding protein [Deltaproteobacteria bacterium]|jgi:NADH-quinone oxidoreductase subunit F|nr:4Fe-4S binding protein [Deltaproteobacteria bacterium]
MPIINLEKITQAYKAQEQKIKKRIIICAGTGCVANGSLKLKAEFEQRLAERGLNVVVEMRAESTPIINDSIQLTGSGCQGFCQMGPLVTIQPDDIFYVKVRLADVAEIVEKTIKNGEIVEHLQYKNQDEAACKSRDEINFYKKQHRVGLKLCGAIDPENVEEYIAVGGYAAAKKALIEMTDVEICRTLMDSGLRGRGGGGFPTGKKWDLTRLQQNKKKYVVCNADEGDPGAFMDRSVMEGSPHRVIEGMLIAAKAIGADEGYVYIRAEYPLAVKRINAAVREALRAGILGKNIFGAKYNFKITVLEGAGAFVCGEETALLASIEGLRGMPKPKPPFPAQSGLFGKPTVINNVETLALVPVVILDGAEEFKARGVPTSTGTKTFALTGHVANTGLIEVPFGTSLREIVFDIGGGTLDENGKVDNSAFKAVQIGGPSGGCLTKEHLDLPLDFDSLRAVGAMVGSGGLVVMNSSTCMVNVARFFMQFTQHESCGKCVPCREGTKQLLMLLDDIVEGRGTLDTLELLEELARSVITTSLCGLGKTAPNPILSTLKHFRDEYLAHVQDKVCPTGQCKALAGRKKVYKILEDKCRGCTACARKCPVAAISGKPKIAHVIDLRKCILCGSCKEICKFGAVITSS